MLATMEQRSDLQSEASAIECFAQSFIMVANYIFNVGLTTIINCECQYYGLMRLNAHICRISVLSSCHSTRIENYSNRRKSITITFFILLHTLYN